MSSGVLHVATDTDRRGAQVFAVDLDAAFLERGQMSHVVALAPGASKQSLALSALGRRRRGPGTLIRLRREIAHADAVIGHGSATLLACAVAGINTGVPFIYRNIGDPAFWARRPTRRLRLQRLFRRADRVVTLSRHFAVTLTEVLRLPPERIRVIPNGVPAARFPPVSDTQRGAARERLGLPVDRPVALYLGALSPEKNVEALVEAVAGLSEVRALIVGDGPLRDQLAALASAVGKERVRLQAAVDDPATVLAAADLLVLPSLSEGVPGVLIEAGLSQLPCVATDVGGVREVIVPGTTGEIVPAGDTAALSLAIKQALARRDEYGAAARAWCMRRFEIGVVADAWEQLLAELAR